MDSSLWKTLWTCRKTDYYMNEYFASSVVLCSIYIVSSGLHVVGYKNLFIYWTQKCSSIYVSRNARTLFFAILQKHGILRRFTLQHTAYNIRNGMQDLCFLKVSTHRPVFTVIILTNISNSSVQCLTHSPVRHVYIIYCTKHGV